ncbi:unnamed protein product [Phytomonas sp. EM1]|nr:unnamed protein product [Phytomonas sp. EM1]|eukprot:CCW61992.1 unnamed protein product [Phytomonas sp. isolate EM1]
MKLISILFLLIFSPILCHCSKGKRLTEIHRIVVVGDIHGDSDNFRKILKFSNLIHEEINENDEIGVIWNPKHEYIGIPLRTTFIQMGDLIDRGQDDRDCLNIAFSLYEQVSSSAHHDQVVLLIGNHELLNLQGSYHYVNPNGLGGFLSRSLRNLAFSPKGPYGRFIIDHFKAVHVEENMIFVHAGFSQSSQYEPMSENELNKLVQKSLNERKYSIPSLGSEGFLWTREMIFDAMKGHCDTVDLVITKFNAKRIIIGHTPQQSGSIGVFCGGKLLAVDVGISRWLYNNLAALEILIYRYKSDDGTLVEDEILWEVNETSRRRLNIIGQKEHIDVNPSYAFDGDFFHHYY